MIERMSEYIYFFNNEIKSANQNNLITEIYFIKEKYITTIL